MSECLVLGAGKIGRGFLGYLLHRSGRPFAFVEKSHDLVDLINTRREYRVHVLGAPEKSTLITNVRGIASEDLDAIAAAVSAADLVFTSVGGKNLEELGPALGRGVAGRLRGNDARPMNIITCENWIKPAAPLRSAIARSLRPRECAALEELVGVAESAVLCSGIAPDEKTRARDPLAVNVQDYFRLPVDASQIRGALPAVQGIEPIRGFQGFLERKLYTYNAANGTVSYLGYLKGYTVLAEAGHDAEILEVVRGVYKETGAALVAKYGLSQGEQASFAAASLRKFQDYTIVDTIERNARDPIRKLGPADRLVGAARLVLEYGGRPESLATAIAAALFYDHPGDPIAVQLRRLRESRGVDAVLRQVCRLEPDSELALLVKTRIGELADRGVIPTPGPAPG